MRIMEAVAYGCIPVIVQVRQCCALRGLALSSKPDYCNKTQSIDHHRDTYILTG
jgi:hypothetical protein